jgi:hypothetical protein
LIDSFDYAQDRYGLLIIGERDCFAALAMARRKNVFIDPTGGN